LSPRTFDNIANEIFVGDGFPNLISFSSPQVVKASLEAG